MVDPPPEVHERLTVVAVAAVATGLVGLGGADCKVDRVVETPLDASGVALPLIAQIRNEYIVPAVRPVTEWLVPVMEDA